MNQAQLSRDGLQNEAQKLKMIGVARTRSMYCSLIVSTPSFSRSVTGSNPAKQCAKSSQQKGQYIILIIYKVCCGVSRKPFPVTTLWWPLCKYFSVARFDQEWAGLAFLVPGFLTLCGPSSHFGEKYLSKIYSIFDSFKKVSLRRKFPVRNKRKILRNFRNFCFVPTFGRQRGWVHAAQQ